MRSGIGDRHAPNAGGYASCAAAQIDARVVYSDVDPVTLLVTAGTLAEAIGPETKAAIVTHLYGNVADVEPIVELCRPLGIRVIEDCAQAIGGMDRDGRRVGSMGSVAINSFYPTKNLGAALRRLEQRPTRAGRRHDAGPSAWALAG